MARSLGQLTVDLLLRTGNFETDAGRASKIADKRAKEIDAAFAKAGKAIGLALAAGVATATVAVRSAINSMDDMSKAAQRVQMPTEDFSRLAFAGSLADVSMQDLTGSLGKLAKTQAEAMRTTSTQSKLFKALGIEVIDPLTGKMRASIDVFRDFADEFQKQKGSTEIMAAGMNIFGRSFQKLIPLLKDGSAGLRAAADESDRLGKTLSGEAGRNAELFNDNLTRMKAAAGGLTQQVAAHLLPRMNELSSEFVNVANDGQRAAQIADTLEAGFDIVAGTLGFVAQAAREAGIGIGFLVEAGSAYLNIQKQMATLGFADGTIKESAQRIRNAGALASEMIAEERAGTKPRVLMSGRDAAPESMFRNAAQLTIEQEAAQRKAFREREAAIAAALGDTPKDGSKAAKSAADKMQREADRLAESQQRWRAELSRTEAQLNGPMSAAIQQHADALEKLAEDTKELGLTEAEIESQRRVIDAEQAKRLADIRKRQNAPNALLADMDREIALLRVVGPARDRLIEQLRAEEVMRDAISEAMANEANLSDDVIAGLVAEASARAEMIHLAEQQAAIAEDYQRNWEGAISSVAGAMGEFFAGGLRDAKSFTDELKSIFKRWLSNVVGMFADGQLKAAFGGVAKWMANFSNGSGPQGAGDGGFVNTVVRGAQRLFAGNQQTGAAATAGNFGIGGTFGTGTISNFGGVFSGTRTGNFGASGGFGGAGSTGAAGSGGTGTGLSGSLSGKLLTGEFASGLSYAGAALGAAGFYYGLTQRGSGGFSSLAAGASYGAAGLVAGGAIAGGVGALGTAAGIGGAGAGAAAGAGGAFASIGGAAWIPVVGWILAALAVIDFASGGKVFGTKFATDSAATNINFGPDGASGNFEQNQSRQKALFGGKKRRTLTSDLTDEVQSEIDKVFSSIQDAMAGAAADIGVDTPDQMAASFRLEFDKKGKLKKEFGTIAGRVYNEAQDVFLQRLVAENLLLVAKAVGAASEIETLADEYRSTPETLTNFASLMLAVQSDIKNARNIWSASGQGVLTDVVELIERMGRGSESLVETYARLTGTAQEYGNLIAGVETQLLTADSNQYQRAQLDIELGYRNQVKEANRLAKALGLSGARAEDLARIEQLRALGMANLQKQMEAQKNTFLDDLGLSDLSPLRDDQKLVESMQLLRDAVGDGDLQRAQQLSQTVLGLGRNLFASGTDYSSLYSEVTGLIDGITADGITGFTDTELGNIADILTGLPKQFATALFDLLFTPTAVAPLPPVPVAPPPPTVDGTTGGSTGGALSGGDPTVAMLQAIVTRLDAVVGNTGETLQRQNISELQAYNVR